MVGDCLLVFSLKGLLDVSSAFLPESIVVACPFAGEPLARNKGLSWFLVLLLVCFLVLLLVCFLAALELFFLCCLYVIVALKKIYTNL